MLGGPFRDGGRIQRQDAGRSNGIPTSLTGQVARGLGRVEHILFFQASGVAMVAAVAVVNQVSAVGQAIAQGWPFVSV